MRRIERMGNLKNNRPPLAVEQKNWQGVNYTDSVDAIQETHVPFAQNVDFGNPIGSATKRGGLESLFTSLGDGAFKNIVCFEHTSGDILAGVHGTTLYQLKGGSGSVTKSSKEDWDAGTKTNVETVSSEGDMKLAKVGTDFSETDTLTADFDGTHSGTEAADDAVKLSNTFDVYGVVGLGPLIKSSFSSSIHYEAGWRFTVGSDPLICKKLRLCGATIGDRTLRLWRVSDQTKIAEVTVTSVVDTWVEGTITDVTLEANTSYVLSLGVPANTQATVAGKTLATFNDAITYNAGCASEGIGVFPTDFHISSIFGIVDLVFEVSGTYTHGIQDVSAVDTAGAATVTYNKTTPAGTNVTFEVRTSTDGGDTWSEWAAKTSGDTVFALGTDISNGRVQWRAKLASTVSGTTPSLDDVTMSVLTALSDTGEWVSPVIDIGNTPVMATLSWNQTTPENTSVAWYARGSDNGVVFGDYVPVLSSGEGIPLNRYIQIRPVLTGDGAVTPTVSDFTIAYSTGYTDTVEIRSGLTGSRVRFANWNNRCYCADGGRPFLLYVDEEGDLKWRLCGVDPPITAPVLAAGGSTGLTGDYYGKVTFVNADGTESNPSPASEKLSVSNKNITWTVPTGPEGTVSRKLYRTKAGQLVYYFVAEIEDNTTTTYTDSITDANLGDPMEDDNNIPPNATIVYEFQNYMLYVDAVDPSQVWVSKVGNPEQVPNTGSTVSMKKFPGPVLGIGSTVNAIAVGGESFMNPITAGSTGFIFDTDPAIDTTMVKEIDKAGPLSHEAIANCIDIELRAILVFPTSTGIRFILPGLQENSLESLPLSRNIQPYYDRAVNRHNMAAVFFNNYYILAFSYRADGAPMPTENNVVFAYDFRSKQWYGPWTMSISGFAAAKRSNQLFAGSATAGKVFKVFSGSADDGGDIEFILDLPPLYPAGVQGLCQFNEYTVEFSADSVTTETKDKVKVDQREASVSFGTLTNTFTGDKRPGHNTLVSREYPIPLPAGKGISHRITDTSKNPLSIRKIVTEYEILEQ